VRSPKRTERNSSGALGLSGLVGIGIGGMAGGFFPVVGLAAQVAGHLAWCSFALGAVVAVVTGVSYARLAVKFPVRGGTITFINRAFGTSVVPGTLNVLLWMGYVMMLALYARAFGSYLSSLTGHPHSILLKHVLATAVLLVLLVANAAEATFVSRLEGALVYPQFTMVAVVALAGVLSLTHPLIGGPIVPMFYAGGLTFLAFEGFELIANAAGDASNPDRDLPRAFTISILAIAALYVLVAVVSVGRVGVQQAVASRDFVVAEVGRSVAGRLGFLLMGFTAVVDAASAINSTFYGTRRLTLEISKDGEMPEALQKPIGGSRLGGLLLTGVASLVVVNLAGLESISLMGSAIFLVMFASVHGAAWRLRSQLPGRGWLPLVGVVLCGAALVAATIYALTQSVAQFAVLGAMLTAAGCGETAVQRRRGRAGADGSVAPDPQRNRSGRI
jgi:amino acid transporter